MLELPELKEIQLDALREVANIGAGHAATALSKMTGRTIMINVPTISIARADDVSAFVPNTAEPTALVHMHMMGDLTGHTLLVFPPRTAARLAQLLLPAQRATASPFDELSSSVLREAGNILCGAYMSALSDFLGVMLLPSPPRLAITSPEASLMPIGAQVESDAKYVFAAETQFFLQRDEVVRGFFLMLPDEPSLHAILRAVRMA